MMPPQSNYDMFGSAAASQNQNPMQQQPNMMGGFGAGM
jgi:hypothetical protein